MENFIFYAVISSKNQGKIINRPRTDPCGTLAVTDFQTED